MSSSEILAMSSSEILNAENHCFYKSGEKNKYIPTWFVETSREDAEILLSAKDVGTVLLRGTRPRTRELAWKYVISSKISSGSKTLHYIVKQGRNGFRLDIEETYKPQWVSCLWEVMDFFMRTIGSIKGNRGRLYSGPGQIRAGSHGTLPGGTSKPPHYMPMNQNNGSHNSASSSCDQDYLTPRNSSDSSSTCGEEYLDPNPVFAPESEKKTKSPKNITKCREAPEYLNSLPGMNIQEQEGGRNGSAAAGSCGPQHDYLNTPKGTNTNGKGSAVTPSCQRVLMPVHDYKNISQAAFSQKEVSCGSIASRQKCSKSPDFNDSPTGTCNAKVQRDNSIKYGNLFGESTPKRNNYPPYNTCGRVPPRPSSPEYAVIDDDDYEMPNDTKILSNPPPPPKERSDSPNTLPRPNNGTTLNSNCSKPVTTTKKSGLRIPGIFKK